MSEDQMRTDLDPRWTAPIYKATSGEDFLGLRAVQGGIVGYLLPGIISITPRARYYPFYCWLLVEYGQSHPEGMSLAAFIRRREQIFVLANLAWSALSEEHPHESGLLGSTKIGRHWQGLEERERIPLRVDDYLQVAYGGYNQYRGVMRALELIRTDEADVLEILPKGQDLARSFAAAIQESRYYHQRETFDTAKSISRSILEEYGVRCHLSALVESPDRLPTQEILFTFDTTEMLPPPQADGPAVGNMKGTLGLILDMIDQARAPFTEEAFRQAVAFGPCSDYDAYRPAEPLLPILAHWRMFQLREYYVYALYALWVYFLHWLCLEGPQTSEAFYAHLNDVVDLAVPAAAAGVDMPSQSPRSWILDGLLDTLLDAAGAQGGDLDSRCRDLAHKSDFGLNEHALYALLANTQPDDAATYVGSAWLLLAILHLRLRGLRDLDQWEAWHWAREGGAHRRSLDLFVRDVGERLGENVLDVWTWLYRDYIVAQHILIALEKWRQRNANTFHFSYEQGIFEWVRQGWTGFTGSRFRPAFVMLADLGMYESLPEEEDRPCLTELGRETLQRVLEACDD